MHHTILHGVVLQGIDDGAGLVDAISGSFHFLNGSIPLFLFHSDGNSLDTEIASEQVGGSHPGGLLDIGGSVVSCLSKFLAQFCGEVHAVKNGRASEGVAVLYGELAHGRKTTGLQVLPDGCVRRSKASISAVGGEEVHLASTFHNGSELGEVLVVSEPVTKHLGLVGVQVINGDVVVARSQ